MRWREVLGLVLVLSGCGSTAGEEPAKAPETVPDLPEGGLTEPFRVIKPNALAPGFRLQTTDGAVLDSQQLVGAGPVVLVFFATWCEVCKLKFPMLRRAVEEGPDSTRVVGVSLDDDSTWRDVPAFLEEHHFPHPVVRATRFVDFARAYDPMMAVPAVIIIGRDGVPVDVQIGVAPSHALRLAHVLELANREPSSGSGPAPTLEEVTRGESDSVEEDPPSTALEGS